MKTLKEMNSIELLTSFNVGQGKTVELPSFASVNDETVRYDGLTATVTQAWKDSMLLMAIHSNLKDAPSQRQEKLFDAYNEGRLSLNHNLESDGVKKPLTGHYLTASEYKANALKLNANVDTITAIEALVNNVSSTSTKDSLMQVISSIARLVFTDEQLTTFNTLSAKEAIFSTVQNELEAIGGKVTIVNDTTIKVNISVSSVDIALKVLTDLQFRQNNADFDAKTMSIVLTMIKESV
jgi:hypothetical protein